MVDVALAVAFFTGLLRWPMWQLALSITLAALFMLCIGADPGLMPRLLLAYCIACAAGYAIGRLAAWGWHRTTSRI